MSDVIAIVGGGVSGLAVAFHLRQALVRRDDVEVVCLEGGAQPGGNIRTHREGGFTCEWGPNGFLDNEPATLELVRAIGIEDRLLPSNRSAARRFIFRGGRLRELPGGPGSFLTSDVLSLGGRLRVLAEPFGRARPDGDESVFSFASRRIGREAASVLVDAMVSGIYAGDVRNLSLKAAFPKMWKMEADHGSLFRAMLAKRKEKRAAGAAPAGGPAGPGGTLTSFRGGMQELVDGLASAIGPSLRTDSRVSRIEHLGARGYRIHLAAGAPPIDASVVVLACPAWHASTATAEMDGVLSETLASIPPAPIAVVHLGFERDRLSTPPDGFGFLAPRGEGPRILGCLWASCIFDGRTGADQVLLTCMIGGAHDPDAITLDDGELVGIAREDLRSTMDLDVEPQFVKIFRHRHGIPQYTLGHPGRVEAIERRLERFPALLVSGNSYRGISVNACAAEAPGVARAALAAYGSSRPVSPA